MENLFAMGFEEDAVRSAWHSSGADFDAALTVLLQGDGEEAVPPVDLPTTAPAGSISAPTSDAKELEISQYTFGPEGTSACTAISCVASATLLKRLWDGEENPADPVVMTECIFRGVDQFRELVRSGQSEHIAADEFFYLCNAFQSQVDMVLETPLQAMVSPGALEDMIQQAREAARPGEPFALVITKPPETVTIIVPPAIVPPSTETETDAPAPSPLYIFFDSHSRPQLGLANGGHVLTADSLAPIIQHFHRIFPPNQLGGVFTALEAAYNTFEGTLFQAKRT